MEEEEEDNDNDFLDFSVFFFHMRLDMRQDWELLKVGNVGNVGNMVIISFPPKKLPTVNLMLVMLGMSVMSVMLVMLLVL